MNRKILTYRILIFLFVSLLVIGIISDAFVKDREYSGKVVDADTKEPIEDAVVVAYWLEATKTLAGDDTRLKEVKETLTDKEGKWSIIGPSHQGRSFIRFLLSFVGGYRTRAPYFIFFKPGYCSLPKGYGVNACKTMRRYSDSTGKIAELPKITNKEDRLKVIPGHVHGVNAGEKQKELIEMINKERKYHGLEEMKQY